MVKEKAEVGAEKPTKRLADPATEQDTCIVNDPACVAVYIAYTYAVVETVLTTGTFVDRLTTLTGVTDGVNVGFDVCVDVTVTSMGVQKSEKGVIAEAFPEAPMTAMK